MTGGLVLAIVSLVFFAWIFWCLYSVLKRR